MTTRLVQPRFLPPLTQDVGSRVEQGHVILRDGTTALIHAAGPADRDMLRAFVDRLSPEARRHRFFSETVPPDEVIATLCDDRQPGSLRTLLVTRSLDGRNRVIAAGSYVARDERSAEIALAVDDAFHGKGLGTLLLERLALLAVRQGFVRLWAVTHADNAAMREVFRESGFASKEWVEGGDIEVELVLAPTAASVARAEWRERIATVASLRPFFAPRSVAVVGASRDPTSIGGRVLRALTAAQFAGPLYAVNPRVPPATILGGVPAYPSLRAVPGPVDLAVVVVPPSAVLDAVDECAAHGVRALVVITAGFAEVGEAGRALQDRVVEKVRGAGMRLVGPNCLGLLNTDQAVRLNASFSPIFPPAGRVAMSSQSGALGLAVLAAAPSLHLGLSTFVSVGNKADVSSNDLLQYWEDDPATDVILLYQESFGNPRRFARLARRVSRRKPIVAVKGGRTAAGTRAAGSHTAALAASETAVDALFRQTGVIRADTLEELFALAAALGWQPLPRGRRVAVVSNAGGPAILCADMCEAGGLLVPTLSEATQASLAAFLPPTAGLANPVDVIASAGAEEFRRALTVLAESGEVDATIVLYVSAGALPAESLAQALREGAQAGGGGRPVLVCWMGDADPSAGPAALATVGLPCYAFPELPARVLSKTAAYAEWRAQPDGLVPEFPDMDLAAARARCAAAVHAGGGWLSAEDTRAVLRAAGLPLAPGDVATTPTAAAAIARRVGYPVALKLASRTLVHKSEVGGVKLDLKDEAAVRRAFEDIRETLAHADRLDAMDGVVVQPMVSGGVEAMVGMAQDRLFGPLIAFGLGGIHVEVLRDVCFRITPLTDRDAAEMVRGIRGFRLLEGYRGHPPADLEAIEDLLLRLSQLVEAVPDIVELDLNPVFALPPGQGCRIVDARIRVGLAGAD